ncbi:hypothetical protein [Actinoplanes teichomyceticus]|nr:hypothetical protein [Actinoplanes teichomyceticus]
MASPHRPGGVPVADRAQTVLDVVTAGPPGRSGGAGLVRSGRRDRPFRH